MFFISFYFATNLYLQSLRKGLPLDSILNNTIYLSSEDFRQVEHFSKTQTLWQHPSSAAALFGHAPVPRFSRLYG